MTNLSGLAVFKKDPLTERIIGAAIEVHRVLGPGLLESTYEECFCFELAAIRLPFERQVPLPIEYKSIRLLRAYRLDLLIDRSVVVELKTVEKILAVHEAQVLTYLRLSGFTTGLLINFNAVPLKSGLRRLTKAIPHRSLRSPSPIPRHGKGLDNEESIPD